jgi:cobalt-precorrin 5A hydrolase
MIVAGIGCRKGAKAADIEAAIATALGRIGCRQEALSAIATHADKREEQDIAVVALAFGLPLIYVAQDDLEAAAARCATHSERVLAKTGLPSVAEAAALAVAGEGARLIVPRVVAGVATCALASDEDAP